MLLQQVVRALAMRLCEQLPPHRKYHKEGRDVDHEAQIHLQRLTRYGIQAVVRHVPVGMQYNLQGGEQRDTDRLDE